MLCRRWIAFAPPAATVHAPLPRTSSPACPGGPARTAPAAASPSPPDPFRASCAVSGAVPCRILCPGLSISSASRCPARLRATSLALSKTFSALAGGGIGSAVEAVASPEADGISARIAAVESAVEKLRADLAALPAAAPAVSTDEPTVTQRLDAIDRAYVVLQGSISKLEAASAAQPAAASDTTDAIHKRLAALEAAHPRAPLRLRPARPLPPRSPSPSPSGAHPWQPGPPNVVDLLRSLVGAVVMQQQQIASCRPTAPPCWRAARSWRRTSPLSRGTPRRSRRCRPDHATRGSLGRAGAPGTARRRAAAQAEPAPASESSNDGEAHQAAPNPKREPPGLREQTGGGFQFPSTV